MRALLALLAGLLAVLMAQVAQAKPMMIETTLAMPVTAAENRVASYTDKLSGYYATRTHVTPDSDWFAGWNIAGKRVLRDYALAVDGKPLDRAASAVRVHPHRLERRHGQATEELTLVDGRPIIVVSLAAPGASRIGLTVLGGLAAVEGADEAGLWLAPAETPGAVILLAPMKAGSTPEREGEGISVAASAGGFVLIHAATKALARDHLASFRASQTAWQAARAQRMERLVADTNRQASSDPAFDRALAWMILTADQLVMRPPNAGIYAGLPWFTDFWGRDTFIALPGTSLVTGQFDDARDVVAAFARLQNPDPASPHYGRVPNRARPGEVIYNTADGTPRFVSAILDTARHTGDRRQIDALFPAVKLATDAALARWVDPAGYLTHDDADTWMDAKEAGTRPFSPRGNRANDIQALWVQQLRDAATMAIMFGDDASAQRWRGIADGVARRFASDFYDTETGALADRLRADGTRDLSMRPNQLFALDLIPDPAIRRAVVRDVWQALAYPWGVASLSQTDPDFHPWHENWHYYHKDAAYHMGTVWQWTNGIAMQRLIEHGQQEMAFALMANMAHDALTRGAVGSLAENADALPREGQTVAALSGTYLQAWSNAEHIRVWRQWFLGIRPDMLAGAITIAPRLPEALRDVQTSMRVGAGSLTFRHWANGRMRVAVSGIAPTVVVDLPDFAPVSVTVPDGGSLEARPSRNRLAISVKDARGRTLATQSARPDPVRLHMQAEDASAFAGLRFATPELREGLKSLSVRHDPPITQ